MNRWLPIVGALLVLLGVGLYGVTRSGPEPGEEPEAVQVKLNGVPMKIGDWQAKAEIPLTEGEVRTGGFRAYLSREYVRKPEGDGIGVLVLYGEPGDLGAHTPDICYGGKGYRVSGAATRLPVDLGNGTKAEFWSARFEKAAGRDPREVIWGWASGGKWSAVENPRFEFAGHRLIYKIYLDRSLGESTEPRRPTEEFLFLFLGELENRMSTRGP